MSKIIENKVKEMADEQVSKITGTVKFTIIGVIIALILVIGIFVAYKMGAFEKEPLKIDQTVNIVEEIRNIGEFTSTCYYEEIVIKSSKSNEFNDTKLGRLTAKVMDEVIDEIVILANGKVRAGFDLSKVNPSSIMASGDTLAITLPQAEIFDVILNPSDYEIYVETGKWSHETVSALQTEASDSLHTHALNFGIIAKAEKSGLTKLNQLFKTFGFNHITIHISKE